MANKKKASNHRSNGRGTLRLDRRYAVVGRIAKASGTNDPTTFRAILTMMAQLEQEGRFRILTEIRDGVLTPMDVYAKWVTGQLDYLTSAASLRLIIPTIPDWIASYKKVSATTQRNYTSEIERFARVVGNIPIHEVPEKMPVYLRYCQDNGIEATFNKLRVAIFSYLTKEFGKNHPLRLRAGEVERLPEVSKRQAPNFSVKEMAAIFAKLPQPHRSMARTMLLTGMHWKEYNGEWEVQEHCVHIVGTKNKNRVRDVPIMDDELVKPSRSSSSFRKALRRTHPTISPLSFRRTYARWMSEAGIPKGRRSAYMGHGVQDMTERYERSEVEAFWAQDAEQFKRYMDAELVREVKPKAKVTPVNSAFKLQLPRLRP
jgi:integrase